MQFAAELFILSLPFFCLDTGPFIELSRDKRAFDDLTFARLGGRGDRLGNFGLVVLEYKKVKPQDVHTGCDKKNGP